jgi:hypothetical protein
LPGAVTRAALPAATQSGEEDDRDCEAADMRSALLGRLRKPMDEPLGNGTIRSRVPRYFFFMLFLYFFP